MAYTFRVYFPYTSRLVHRVQYIINYSSMTIVKQDKTRKPERTSLHSFNLLWLMWAVCGGFFITNFILSNWLTILVKPVFEKPVDTAQVQPIFNTRCKSKAWIVKYSFQDVYDRSLTPINTSPGSEIQQKEMSLLPAPYPQLAERMHLLSSYYEFINLTRHYIFDKESFSFLCKIRLSIWNKGLTLLFQGTHTYLVTHTNVWLDSFAEEKGTTWYRSAMKVPLRSSFVGGGYMSNKKWPLNEESDAIFSK